MKTKLENLIKEYGWSKVFDCLQNIADENELTELSRELESLIVNYIPEVR